MLIQFLQCIQLLVAIYAVQNLLYYTYLLKVELHVFAYLIMMDDCNTDKLRTEQLI